MAQEPEVIEVDGEMVDSETGEVIEQGNALALRKEAPAKSGGLVSMQQVAELVSPENLEAHRKVMAAYDQAVAALIGPNDIVERGGKQFKKKSAWKKLGRVFHIDTEIVHLDGGWVWDPEEEVHHYEAEAYVRGTAPWGQTVVEYGGCSTRESRFHMTYPACPQCGGPMWDNRQKDWGGHFGCKDKDCGVVLNEGDYDPARIGEQLPNPMLRQKALHDTKATAVTRATNRAVSALIAAGEVSAEEVEQQEGQSVRRSSASKDVQAGSNGGKQQSGGGPGFLDSECTKKKYQDKGMTWRQIMQKNPHYIEWIIENDKHITDQQRNTLRAALEQQKHSREQRKQQKKKKATKAEGDGHGQEAASKDQVIRLYQLMAKAGLSEEENAKLDEFIKDTPTADQARRMIEKLEDRANNSEDEEDEEDEELSPAGKALFEEGDTGWIDEEEGDENDDQDGDDGQTSLLEEDDDDPFEG